MATGYIFTKTGNSSTKVVHVTNDVVDLGRTKIFKGPVLIEENDSSLISIKEGGGNAMSLNIGAIVTIDGSAPAGTMEGVIDQLDAVFPDASTTGGSGGGVTVAFNESIPFTRANTMMDHVVDAPIALSPNTTGAVAGNGATVRLVADGVNTPTLDAAFTVDPGSDTYDNTTGRVHQYYFYFNGTEYIVNLRVLPVIVSIPDTTAPTVTSITATNANTIRIVFSEAVTGTTAGYSFNNGSALTIASRTGSGTNTWDFTISQTMADTDTITGSFNSGTGNSVDGASNALATYSNHAVTNSITSWTLVGNFVFTTNQGFTLYPDGSGVSQIASDGGTNALQLAGTGPSANYGLAFKQGLFTLGQHVRITPTIGTMTSGSLSFALGSGSGNENIHSYTTSGVKTPVIIDTNVATTADYLFVGAGGTFPNGNGFFTGIKVEVQ